MQNGTRCPRDRRAGACGKGRRQPGHCLSPGKGGEAASAYGHRDPRGDGGCGRRIPAGWWRAASAGPVVVTISISAAAFASIAATLPTGSKAEARPEGKGAYLVTLDRNVLDRSPIAARAGGELFGCHPDPLTCESWEIVRTCRRSAV